MKRVWRLLASTRLAAWIIGALVVLCLVSFLVPQRSHADITLYNQWSAANPALASVARAIGADDVFVSAPFLALAAVLAANLIACTLDRARSYARASARGTASISRLGSLVMHVGILLVLIAGVLSGLTRFDGRIALTEGQTLPDAPGSYLRAPSLPRLGAAFGASTVRLDSLRAQYDGSAITQAFAQLTFADGASSSTQEVSVNSPARWRGKSYLLLKGGHAVRLGATSMAGEQLFPDAVVRLGDKIEGGYGDTVMLANGRKLEIATFADASNPKAAAEQPLRLADPVVTLRVAGGKDVVHLRPGSVGQVDGVEVKVSDVRLWNEFAVKADRATPVAYAAFAVMVLGAAVRFGFARRRPDSAMSTSEGGEA
jgi:cytochrome c biogenesis protein ResB